MIGLRNEEGSTLAAVLAVLMVVAVVAVTALQSAMHANDVTVVGRERLLAVQAAEAGVGSAMERLESNPDCDLGPSSPTSLTDQEKTLAYYQTQVEPDAGTLCADTNLRVIRAWGQAPTTDGRSLRQLEVTVKLIPAQGFRFSLFASGDAGIVTVKNTGTIAGDVYAESLDQSQNNINAWDVVTPGSIDTKDNAVYGGGLWAGGDITLRQNGQVTGSLIAAGSSGPGDISLENNVDIAKDVRAAGSVTLPTNYDIGGSVAEDDNNLPIPPTIGRPTFAWNPANYDPPPYPTFATAAQLSAQLDLVRNDLKGVFYTTDGVGTVTLPKNATVTGPLTIVTEGKVDVHNAGSSFSSSGGPWQVVIVSLNTGPEAISISKPSIFAPSLHVLLFSDGQISVKNKLTMTGSLYADAIELKNSVAVNYSQLLADGPPVGFDFTLASAAQFIVVPVLWREVAPGDPPT